MLTFLLEHAGRLLSPRVDSVDTPVTLSAPLKPETLSESTEMI